MVDKNKDVNKDNETYTKSVVLRIRNKKIKITLGITRENLHLFHLDELSN